MKVNCAALPAELLESELFGFERGAFTGAIQHKPGKFEFANHGTMFLDEISEMSAPLQSKLLQVLQDGEFARLGGRQDVHVDVRVVAATNRDLEVGGRRRAVPRGPLLPPERRLHHAAAAAPAPRRDPGAHRAVPARSTPSTTTSRRSALATDTLRLFAEYDWPGNVRELENLIKRMVILGSDDVDPPRGRRGDRRTRRCASGPIPALQPTAAARAPPVAAAAAPAPPAPRRPRRLPRGLGGSLKDIARTCRARSRARADLPHAAADPLEPPRSGGDPRHQLQGAALQDQGSGARQGIVMPTIPSSTRTSAC